MKIMIQIRKNTFFQYLTMNMKKLSNMILCRCNLLINTYDLSHLPTFYDKN